LLKHRYSSYFARLLMQAKSTLFTLLTISFLLGCNDQPTCIPEQTDLVKISFSDIVGKTKTIALVSLTVDDSNESFPVITDSTASLFSIPLNPLDSSLVIRFEQESETNYLALSYTTKLVILNPDCILETKFENLQIDSTNFIDAIIIEPLLSPDTNNNVSITH